MGLEGVDGEWNEPGTKDKYRVVPGAVKLFKTKRGVVVSGPGEEGIGVIEWVQSFSLARKNKF